MAASGLMSKDVSLNIDIAAQRHHLAAASVMAKLEDWHDKGIIELQKADAKAVFRVLKHLPSAAPDIKLLVPGVYRALQQYESNELQKIRETIAILTDRGCVVTRLSQLTDDSDEDNVTIFECGNCTWCKTGSPIRSPVPPIPSWDRELFEKVLKAIGARDDARFLAFVAFGVPSPRVVREGLNRPGTVFGSMAGHDFDVSILGLSASFAAHFTNTCTETS